VRRDEEIAAALWPIFVAEATALSDAIETASAAGRRGEVCALAHRLIGTAGTVGESGVVEAARRLEDEAGAASGEIGPAVAAALAAIEQAVAREPPVTAGTGARPVHRPGASVVVAIEDDAANARLLERIFESVSGIELLTARNGNEGVRLARERGATVVLLDMNLPDGSGERVLERLRDEGGGLRIRVIVVSADATPEKRETARALGAFDYVAKPFDVASLRLLVEEACRGRMSV
jgi:CheY-like chemotaxis protein